MIDLGANPHVRSSDGYTHYDVMYDFMYDAMGLSNLKNVPLIKSVFYPIRTFSTGNLGEPWCYTTGVYDGKFGRIIGKGGEGTVIQGQWNGRKAAYKFVLIKMVELKLNKDYVGLMEDMNERLKEMTEMMTTAGDAILPFQAHFR